MQEESAISGKHAYSANLNKAFIQVSDPALNVYILLTIAKQSMGSRTQSVRIPKASGIVVSKATKRSLKRIKKAKLSKRFSTTWHPLRSNKTSEALLTVGKGPNYSQQAGNKS